VPPIFSSLKRKNWKVVPASHDGAWVGKIHLECSFTFQHLTQFVDLWTLIHNIILEYNVEDDIVWILTPSGQYSANSAYEVQCLGSASSSMHKAVWEAWAHPKVKFFAWLANPKIELDGGSAGEVRMARLWALPSFQAMCGIR
jgi:hypothetical protein